jgi:uncharacterized membrane protein
MTDGHCLLISLLVCGYSSLLMLLVTSCQLDTDSVSQSHNGRILFNTFLYSIKQELINFGSLGIHEIAIKLTKTAFQQVTIIIIIIGSTVLVRALVASHRRFRNLIRTLLDG